MRSNRRRLQALAPALVLTGVAMALGGAAFAQDADTAITVVLDQEPDTLDPCELTKKNVGFVIRENIIETVTEIDQQTGQVVPRLAESWENVDDNTWRFKLRPGVKFHDGTPLTSEAFVKAFNRMMDPNLSCSNRVLYFEGMNVELTPVDDLTVDIKTPEPSPIMPVLLAMAGIEAPSTDPNALVRNPIGTGPYKLVNWQSGQNIVAERNADYWGEEPEVSKVTYVFREEPSVRAAMVANGEADIAPVIAPQDATNPDTDRSYLNSETVRLRFDIEKPPLDDIRVRQAINYAIDRAAMIGTVYSPTWIAAKHMVMPTIYGYNDEVEAWPYDPDKARALVDEARADGVPVDNEILLIMNSTTPGGAEAPTVMIEMMNDAGLNVRLQILESAEFYKFFYKPFADGQPANMLLESHDNNSGDAGFSLVAKYSSWGGTSKLNDADVDATIKAGLSARDPERGELFRDVFAKVHDLAVDAVLFHQTADTRVGPRISFTPTAATNAELQISQITFNPSN